MDFTCLTAHDIYFYTDASSKIGMGAINNTSWMYYMWDERFLTKYQPQIQCLEMYALVAAVITWIHRYRNRCVTIFTDNRNVMNAVNDNSMSCKQCMVLVRILVLHCLNVNVRVFVNYVRSKDNELADALSHGQLALFKQKAKKAEIELEHTPTPIPSLLLPMEKIWEF